MNQVEVSIIIVNYNTYELLLDCIKSIKANTSKLNYEIIVVDNCSPDRNIEQLNTIYSDVKLILNSENSGFGSANNLGNKYANGKYIFLLNSDTILIDNSIYTLYHFMRNNTSVGACGGNLCDAKLNPATSFTRFMPSIKSDLDYLFFSSFSKLLFSKNVNYSYHNEPFEIAGNISGADLMLLKSAYDEIGGFDEEFFMYYEETDLLARLRKAGYTTYIVPQSKIIHLEGASESLQARKLTWTHESKKKYYKKHKYGWELFVSDSIFTIIIIQRLLIFRLLHNVEKYKYWSIYYTWWRNRNRTMI